MCFLLKAACKYANNSYSSSVCLTVNSTVSKPICQYFVVRVTHVRQCLRRFVKEPVGRSKRGEINYVLVVESSACKYANNQFVTNSVTQLYGARSVQPIYGARRRWWFQILIFTWYCRFSLQVLLYLVQVVRQCDAFLLKDPNKGGEKKLPRLARLPPATCRTKFPSNLSCEDRITSKSMPAISCLPTELHSIHS
jgi:hypothetical protein